MRKKVLWIVFVMALAGAVWTYRDDLRQKMFPEEITVTKVERLDDGNELQQEVTSFVIDGSNAQGKKQWQLEAVSAVIEDEAIHLTDLKAVAYGDEVTATLTSDRGIYYRGKGAVDLMGRVRCVSDNGAILTTDRAKWSHETKEVTTDDIVHITGEGLKAVGKGGMANSDKRTATLMKDVEVIIEPDTKVNCDGPLDIDQDKNVAVFYNNVVVEDKDGKLFADKLTAEINPETRKLMQVTVEGNVRTKKGNSYTVSEKGVYSDSTKSVKLSGNPRIVLDPMELDEFKGLKEKRKKADSGGEKKTKDQGCEL